MLTFELPVFILPACFNLHSEIRGNIKILWYERAEPLQIRNPAGSAVILLAGMILRVSIFQGSPTVPNPVSKKRLWQLLSSSYW